MQRNNILTKMQEIFSGWVQSDLIQHANLYLEIAAQFPETNKALSIEEKRESAASYFFDKEGICSSICLSLICFLELQQTFKEQQKDTTTSHNIFSFLYSFADVAYALPENILLVGMFEAIVLMALSPTLRERDQALVKIYKGLLEKLKNINVFSENERFYYEKFDELSKKPEIIILSLLDLLKDFKDVINFINFNEKAEFLHPEKLKFFTFTTKTELNTLNQINKDQLVKHFKVVESQFFLPFTHSTSAFVVSLRNMPPNSIALVKANGHNTIIFRKNEEYVFFDSNGFVETSSQFKIVKTAEELASLICLHHSFPSSQLEHKPIVIDQLEIHEPSKKVSSWLLEKTNQTVIYEELKQSWRTLSLSEIKQLATFAVEVGDLYLIDVIFNHKNALKGSMLSSSLYLENWTVVDHLMSRWIISSEEANVLLGEWLKQPFPTTAKLYFLEKYYNQLPPEIMLSSLKKFSTAEEEKTSKSIVDVILEQKDPHPDVLLKLLIMQEEAHKKLSDTRVNIFSEDNLLQCVEIAMNKNRKDLLEKLAVYYKDSDEEFYKVIQKFLAEEPIKNKAESKPIVLDNKPLSEWYRNNLTLRDILLQKSEHKIDQNWLGLLKVEEDQNPALAFFLLLPDSRLTAEEKLTVLQKLKDYPECYIALHRVIAASQDDKILRHAAIYMLSRLYSRKEIAAWQVPKDILDNVIKTIIEIKDSDSAAFKEMQKLYPALLLSKPSIGNHAAALFTHPVQSQVSVPEIEPTPSASTKPQEYSA